MYLLLKEEKKNLEIVNANLLTTIESQDVEIVSL
jgi:hypothetical protein